MTKAELNELQPGDMVFAAATIANDGYIPEIDPDAVLANPGTRGMLMNIGHLREDPKVQILLVRFEDEQGNIGMPVGCYPEEITLDAEAYQ